MPLSSIRTSRMYPALLPGSLTHRKFSYSAAFLLTGWERESQIWLGWLMQFLPFHCCQKQCLSQLQKLLLAILLSCLEIWFTVQKTFPESFPLNSMHNAGFSVAATLPLEFSFLLLCLLWFFGGCLAILFSRSLECCRKECWTLVFSYRLSLNALLPDLLGNPIISVW